MIKRVFVKEIQLTPLEIATEFCEMDGDQQARFFNAIGFIVETGWEGKHFSSQMYNISTSTSLNDDGKNILNIIKEYVD